MPLAKAFDYINTNSTVDQYINFPMWTFTLAQGILIKDWIKEQRKYHIKEPSRFFFRLNHGQLVWRRLPASWLLFIPRSYYAIRNTWRNMRSLRQRIHRTSINCTVKKKDRIHVKQQQIDHKSKQNKMYSVRSLNRGTVVFPLFCLLAFLISDERRLISLEMKKILPGRINT